ncbi:MAG: IclR family transcriptional regulator [Pararhodobacter sp.]|nr:IclR family transcriptional regulator [Pararhodobacter sp.]
MSNDSVTSASPEGAPREPGLVNALARGLSLLAAFEPEDRALGNQELAERTGLPKPTVSRLARTLTELGYLIHHQRAARYSLSPKVLELGYAALASSGISLIARPIMRQLSEMDDVAVALGVQSRNAIRYIDLVRRPEAVVLSLDIGSRLPLLRSAMGRAWLAALPEAACNDLAERIAGQEGDTPASILDQIARYRAEFKEYGYVTSLGEWRPEIHAAATVIQTGSAREPLIINVGGLASIMSESRIRSLFGPALVSAANKIQVGLGEPPRR